MTSVACSIIRTVDESYDNKMCVFSVNNSSQVNTSISFSFINDTCTGDENYLTIYTPPLYNCRQAMLPSAPKTLSQFVHRYVSFLGTSNSKQIIFKAVHLSMQLY